MYWKVNKKMSERERIEYLRKKLEELNSLRQEEEKTDEKKADESELNDNELTSMPGVEGRVIEQKPLTKTLGSHPSSGNYAKSSSQNDERGFLNIFILVLFVIVFQITFVLSLYFLFS